VLILSNHDPLRYERRLLAVSTLGLLLVSMVQPPQLAVEVLDYKDTWQNG
jgi:hypothetical protein